MKEEENKDEIAVSESESGVDSEREDGTDLRRWR